MLKLLVKTIIVIFSKTMSIIFLIFLAWSSIGVVVESQCPTEWKYYMNTNSCYKVCSFELYSKHSLIKYNIFDSILLSQEIGLVLKDIADRFTVI